MAKKIKNIVFDMGRVLVDFSVKGLLTRYFPDVKNQSLMENILFDSGEWDALDAGAFSEEEALRRWEEKTPETLRDGLRAMFFHWHEMLTPIDGMAELVRELKSNGYGCYLLSNTSVRFFTYWEKFEALRYMDGKIISAEHYLLKPDPAIYQRLFDCFGLDPAECFFIDDCIENIQGAERVGMRGFLFRTYDVEKLRSALREQGVQII